MAAIENVGNLEVQRLEKSLPLLATVASGAPMIGFLGTVTGMIRAFYNMAQAGANVDVSLLSSGIYEALVTTVGGLIVGILSLFAYNYLTTRVSFFFSGSFLGSCRLTCFTSGASGRSCVSRSSSGGVGVGSTGSTSSGGMISCGS